MENTPLALLHRMRDAAGERVTHGLDDETVGRFLQRDPALGRAIQQAWERFRALPADTVATPETELAARLQDGLVNFYEAATVNPYVALAAAGPWIVTLHGAVLHDNGGYGMLGAGHGPENVIAAMARDHVMANVMTPSLSHARLVEALRREIGHARGGACPYDGFICMNSGSEAVTVTARISDVNARRQTDPGGPHAGRRPVLLSLQGAFHGRTDRPAQISDSCMGTYRRHLASFRDRDNLLTVPPNDVEALRAAFARAEAEGLFIEGAWLEPVMGEGVPGMLVDRAFYDEARRLTREHGSLLVVDSIQAGLRGTGALSIVDYPGFEDAEPPDMETWSKALNAGQYPLSVIGLTRRAADLYVRGIYGNTMTTNPRACEVAAEVLAGITPEVRRNIVDRGHELVSAFEVLHADYPDMVEGVRGTGLLVAIELDPERVQVVGFDGAEQWCRRHGLGVIHGGRNALRFTPHFRITSDEVQLIARIVRDCLEHFRRASAGDALSAGAAAPSPA